MRRIAGIKARSNQIGIRGSSATTPSLRSSAERPRRQTPRYRAMLRAAAGSLLFAAALAGAACNSATRLEFDDENGPFVSIAHLKSLCRGSSTRLTRELKIEGIVTANDIRDEFPKTLVVEDASGGIEIAVDRTDLANLFPLGARVSVYCSGLALGDYGGKVQLGAPPTGEYSVDRIPGSELDRYIRCTALNAGTRRPQTVRFAELTAGDADRYVRFETVRFLEAGEPWCGRDPETGALQTTVRTLADSSGGRFPVRVLPSCHYAEEPVPPGTGSVNGIVDYFNGELSLRIVNYEIDLAIAEAPPKACLSAAEYSIPRPTR
ncbi:DUF5689 domain-containing protein [Alistipes sp.]|uniref:DUF5689 domain-containing protein n=1 Tax=Alistipes sp. TaxID=1872444 RepID=UPI001FA211FB|nr:DUF5689 domain-containing protein [Alistipes sp.]HJC76107.1 hypothetical protein [Candidatus Alistipes excrementavium]